MSRLWSRLFGGREAPTPPAAPRSAATPPGDVLAPPPEPPSFLARLLAFDTPDGPALEEALDLLAQARSTAHEGRALQELSRRHATRPLPDPLAVAIASALLDRGEPEGARRLLAHAALPPALMLRADLEANAGNLDEALALVERVLVRDLDHPGARERHLRLRQALGIGVVPPPEPSNATMLTSEPEAPYVLLREIARGGAGAVYEAEDRDLGRRLALKVYHDPAGQRSQLLHEARVATELAGPGVVRVFDLEPDHGWIALEWAERGALRDRIREKDRAALLPVERWAAPLARALARVHAAGWVHLDVKPANVLLDAACAPLLADFGVARRAGSPTSPGSFGYVSPERLSGHPADPRDDVYGFGRILEDVLDAVALPDVTARFRALAQDCVAPAAARLGSARELVTRLRTEHPP